MKKIITCLLAALGLTSACAQQTFEVDEFQTKSGKTVRLHALMHASIRIEYDGMDIQVDPVSKLRERTTDYSLMPKAKFILVTHEHGDHYDEAALKLLSDSDTRFVMNQRTAEMLGPDKPLIFPMVNGQCFEFDEIRVDAVPAYNTTAGREHFHPKGHGNGYLLTIDGLRIYVAGDTEDIPEMEDLSDIDIAFLPVNQPYTMTVDQCVRAARMIAPKVLIPYHFSGTDLSKLPSRLPGVKVLLRKMQ